ncbi:DUF1828 domain-containing protein [Leptolyngbya sp. AN02str]|uniref:DUF1828 domain-containing protein n=1 Tax=Leptolyngbya sp. AN02str TaxID=3423363 RepID=UPI003D322B9B
MTNLSICEEIASTVGELFSCSSVGEYTRIRTPYVYPDGDVVDLFAKINNETIILTDLGETIRWLNMQTFAKQRSKKQDLLIQDICLTHRVEFYRSMLIARTKASESLISAVTRLSQAALQVADLWFTFKTSGFTSIKEEVEDFLMELNISYERDYKVPGSSGRSWNIDFYARRPQKTFLIYVLSTGSRASAKNLTDRTFTAWYDLRSLKTSLTSASFISLIDDSVDIWSSDSLSLLEEFSDVIYWSQPELLREELVSPV